MQPENQPAPQAQPQAPEPQAQPQAQPQAPQQEQQPQAPQQPVENSDPFAELYNNQPSQQPEPVTPQPSPQTPQVPQPGVTSEVSSPQPVQQPTPQPQAQPQPQQPQQQPAPQQDRYLNDLSGVVSSDGIKDLPDISKIDGNDPAAIQQWFKDYAETIEHNAMAKAERKARMQTIEQRAWNEAFDKYPSIKTNKNLRDTVHAIRIRAFQQGNPISPTQAAQQLLESLNAQYRQGQADSKVQSQTVQVQPQFGGTQTPTAPSGIQQDDLVAVQDGGEQALAEILARQFSQ